MSFNQVSVNPIQSKLQFKDVMLLSSLSKKIDRLLQFIDNVENVFTLHYNSLCINSSNFLNFLNGLQLYHRY